MSNTNIYIRVIGTMDVKKHKNNVDGSRRSITLYRTVTASGSTGTTVFLLSGKILRRGFKSRFMMNYGAALGSGIIIAETAYVTTKVW